MWFASQIPEMTQPIWWQTFPPTVTSSGSLLLAVREKGAEGEGDREGGGSRLQVAVGRSYRLGQGRDLSGLWHV